MSPFLILYARFSFFFLEFSSLLLSNINNSLFLVIFTSLPSSLPSLRSKYVKKRETFLWVVKNRKKACAYLSLSGASGTGCKKV